MLRIKPIAAVALFCVALPLAACDGGRFDCQDDGTCDLVEQRYSLSSFHIEGRQSHVFTVDGTRYELVHFEYGQGNDCAAGCFYSHLCTVVVDGGADYPAAFGFNHESEQLFDPTPYCADWSEMNTWSNADCDMPAFDLPLMGSSGFRNWVLNPADENDEMRWCRHVFENRMSSPR